MERESDESDLENENEDEEEYGNNPTTGDFDSKKFTKRLKTEVSKRYTTSLHQFDKNHILLPL